MEWNNWYAVIILCFLIALSGLAAKAYIKLTTGMCRCSTRLDGKTAVVTGANCGIGYEAAAELAQRGARVLLACRDPARGRDAAARLARATGNADVHFRQLDLASLASVREFAATVQRTEPRLHILVNNAGAGGLGKRTSGDGLDLAFQVNVFRPFLLNDLLRPLLSSSPPSRVITVSSCVHRFSRVDCDDLELRELPDGLLRDARVYSSSKLCSIILANEMARRLRGTGVTSNSLHPGVASTEAYRHVPAVARIPILFFVRLLFKSSREGAQTTVHLALCPSLETVSGQYFSDCKPSAASPRARDAVLADRLWRICEQRVSMHPLLSVTNDRVIP